MIEQKCKIINKDKSVDKFKISQGMSLEMLGTDKKVSLLVFFLFWFGLWYSFGFHLI